MKQGANWNHLPPLSITSIMVLLVLSSVVTSTAGPLSDDERCDITPLWWEEWYRDGDHNGIDDTLDEEVRSSEKSTTAVYIDYDHRPTPEDEMRLEEIGVSVSYRASYIDTICVDEAPMSMLERIIELPGVVLIERQPIFVPLLDIGARSVKARGSSEYSPDTAWEYKGGYTGDGVTIAVLDTGIDDSHDFLKGKFKAGVDFTDSSDPRDGSSNPDDFDGHGTHVASTALGNGGDDEIYMGVAPDADLVDVKVLHNWGGGTDLIEGIEWCIQYKDRYSIDVLSISIGEFRGGDDDGTDADARAATQAISNGLVVVAAIGNEGNSHKGISSPASADGVIAVGAIDDKNTVDRDDDVIADFSQKGPRRDDGDDDDLDELKPDVTAPGVDITAANNAKVGSASGYGGVVEKSGTSMACPMVSGVVALMLEANPELEPSDVQDILRMTAEPKGDPSVPEVTDRYNNLYGWGMVDAFEAVRLASGDFLRTSIISPSSGVVVGGDVTISGTASNTNGMVNRVEVRVGSGNWEMADVTQLSTDRYSWSYTWDSRASPNGPVTIQAQSASSDTTSSPVMITVTVNNILMTFTSVLNGSRVEDSVTIEGSSSGTEVSVVEYSLDRVVWSRALDTSLYADWSTWKFTVDTNSLSNGEQVIYTRAQGPNGYSDTYSITLVVDNEKGGADSPGFDVALMMGALAMVLLLSCSSVRRRR